MTQHSEEYTSPMIVIKLVSYKNTLPVLGKISNGPTPRYLYLMT